MIADEFHLFGGQKGMGWKKMDSLARHLQAPLVLASATPNYNDAERCYCIQHVLDPLSCRGGYLQFIYQNCETEQNPFGMEPKVTGFLHYGCSRVPGLVCRGCTTCRTIWSYNDPGHPVQRRTCRTSSGRTGHDKRRHRMVASIIEMVAHRQVARSGGVRTAVSVRRRR